jgi:chromosome segregation ATPase
MIMRKNKLIFVAAILFGGAGACASSSHGDQVRDARIAQADDTAHARERAVETTAEERAEAIDQRYDTLRKEVANSDHPDANEADRLLKLSQERAEYQSDAQEQLDKLAVRIDAAQQKISVLGDNAPAALREDLRTTRQEHTTLAQELATLRAVRSPSWESDKDRIEHRISELKDRVGKLDDKIENAAG